MLRTILPPRVAVLPGLGFVGGHFVEEGIPRMNRSGLVVEDDHGLRFGIVHLPLETLHVGDAVLRKGDPDVAHEVGELVSGLVTTHHETTQPDVVENERHLGAMVGREGTVHVRGRFCKDVEILLCIAHRIAKVRILVDALQHAVLGEVAADDRGQAGRDFRDARVREGVRDYFPIQGGLEPHGGAVQFVKDILRVRFDNCIGGRRQQVVVRNLLDLVDVFRVQAELLDRLARHRAGIGGIGKGKHRPGLNDAAVEETLGRRRAHQDIHLPAAARLAEDSNVVGIAAEGFDVLMDPFQGLHHVHDARHPRVPVRFAKVG